MFCSTFASKKISKFHERVLRIVYDYYSKFEEHLTKDGSFTKHHQDIQTVAPLKSKISNGFSQVSFLDLFHNYNENNFYSLRSQPDFQIPRINTALKGIEFYSLRSQPDFQIPRINTALKGIEFIRYFRPVIWNNIPIKIRSIKNFGTLKTEIRNWKPTNCSCSLCKTYVKDLRFINISK